MYHIDVHAYIHTYIHTYIHSYIYINSSSILQYVVVYYS